MKDIYRYKTESYKNIYQFLLWDKVVGRTRHVQWGFERDKYLSSG